MSVFKRTKWGEDTFGPHRAAGAEVVEPVYADEPPYVIEARTWNGTVLRRLPDWVSARWTRNASTPSELEFTYAADADVWDVLAAPNTIALYERRVLREVFYVARRGRSIGADGEARYTVFARGMLGLLGCRHRIESYSTPDPAERKVTVREIVNDLLDNYQTNEKSATISVGSIDSDIGEREVELSGDKTSILGLLDDLRAMVGGYLYVDAHLRLQWRRTMGANVGQQIRMGKNVSAVSYDEDFETIATRVVYTGKGIDDETRLVSQADGVTQSTYGVISDFEGDTGIWKQGELDSVAAARAAALAQPSRTVTCEAIDLSVVDHVDYAFDALDVGKRVRLIYEPLELVYDTTIKGITRDLAFGTQVTIEVGDADKGEVATTEASKTVVDVIADLVSAANEAAVGDDGTADVIADAIADALEPYAAADAALQLADVAIDGRLDTIESGQVTQDGRIDALEGRADALEEHDGVLNSGLSGLAEDVSGLDGRVTSLEQNPAVPDFGSDIQSVGTTNQEGESDTTARSDHVHAGKHHDVENVGSIPSASGKAGHICYVSGTKRFYYCDGTNWICYTHWEVPEEA